MTKRRAWNSSLPAPTAPIPRSRIAPRKRSASEFARIYGNRARVKWVKSLPCVVCGAQPCDNAHTETGGMGRKADYPTIVPLCCMAWDAPNSPGYSGGHHRVLHSIGRSTFEEMYRVDLRALAAATEAAWLAHLGGDA